MTAVARMRQTRGEQLGTLFALSSDVLWALFPILLSPKLNPVTPLYFGALSTLIACIPTFALLVARKSYRDLLVWRAYPPALVSSLMIGAVYSGIIFVGTSKTSPVNAALLPLLEVVASIVMLYPFASERLSLYQLAGAGLMLCGAAIAVFPGHLKVNNGDLMILAACLIPPYGNFLAKQARKLIGSEAFLLIRSVSAGLILFGAASFFEPPPSRAVLFSGLPYLLANGILLMSLSKVLWLEAIYRIPIPKAVVMVATIPATTSILSWLILGLPPTTAQYAALSVTGCGLILVTRKNAQILDVPES